MYFFFLFPWKLLAARLTTRAAVMTLDTRSHVDSALSTLTAFVAEPLGGTIGRALKKRRRKKGLAAASEGIRAKLILIQQYRHIGVFFLRADQTEAARSSEGRAVQVQAGLFMFKDVQKIIQMTKTHLGNVIEVSFCEIKQKLQCFHTFLHLLHTICFRYVPLALGVIDCTHSSTYAAFLNTRIWRATLQQDVWEHSLKHSLFFFFPCHQTAFSPSILDDVLKLELTNMRSLATFFFA